MHDDEKTGEESGTKYTQFEEEFNAIDNKINTNKILRKMAVHASI